jgi:hypothetical protein
LDSDNLERGPTLPQPNSRLRTPTGVNNSIPTVTPGVRQLLKNFYSLKFEEQDFVAAATAASFAGGLPVSSRAKVLTWPQMRWVTLRDSRAYGTRRAIAAPDLVTLPKQVYKKPDTPTEEWETVRRRPRRGRKPRNLQNYAGVPWLLTQRNPFEVLGNDPEDEEYRPQEPRPTPVIPNWESAVMTMAEEAEASKKPSDKIWPKPPRSKRKGKTSPKVMVNMTVQTDVSDVCTECGRSSRSKLDESDLTATIKCGATLNPEKNPGTLEQVLTGFDAGPVTDGLRRHFAVRGIKPRSGDYIITLPVHYQQETGEARFMSPKESTNLGVIEVLEEVLSSILGPLSQIFSTLNGRKFRNKFPNLPDWSVNPKYTFWHAYANRLNDFHKSCKPHRKAIGTSMYHASQQFAKIAIDTMATNPEEGWCQVHEYRGEDIYCPPGTFSR